MTIIQSVATTPGGVPLGGATVTVALVTGSTTPGFTTGGTIVGATYVTTSDVGAWSIDLTPNSTVTPSGTYYRITEQGGAVYQVVAPATGGPYHPLDVLVTTPTGPDSLALLRSANLADLTNKAVARTNLGLGDAALADVGTTAGTVAAGNDSRLVGAVQRGTLLYNVKDYGAVGDGTANDTTAIQSALTAAVAAGVPLYIPAGTYRVAGLSIPSYAVIIGAGSEQTVVKLPDGGSGPVLISANFGALTGGGTSGGAAGVKLSGLTIDGNKSNATLGTYGLAKYGYRWQITDVQIQNCKSLGWWSEWGPSGLAGADGGLMEDFCVNVRIHDCDAGGVRWRGPHDSRFIGLLIYDCLGEGFRAEGLTGSYHSGTLFFSAVHVYGCYGDGVIMTSDGYGASFGGHLTSESNHGNGLTLASSGTQGAILHSYNNFGHGLDIQSSAIDYSITAKISTGTGAGVNFTADGGGMVTAFVRTSAGKLAMSGTPSALTSLHIVSTGAGTNTNTLRLGGTPVATATDTAAILGAVGTPLRTGVYYTAPAGAPTTSQSGEASMRGLPMIVGRSTTLTRIGVEVTGAGTAGAVIRLGLYEFDPDADTLTLLVDAGTIDGTSATYQERTISQAVTVGQVIVPVAVMQGGAVTRPTMRASSPMTLYPAIGSTAAATLGSSSGFAIAISSVPGALPASATNVVAAGNVTGTPPPRVLVKA